jgi:hypothetical protein
MGQEKANLLHKIISPYSFQKYKAFSTFKKGTK